MELFGDKGLEWVLLWTGVSGMGLDSRLLPALELSDPGLRLAGNPVVSRLVLGGIPIGIGYGLKRRRGRVLLRKGFLGIVVAALVAGIAEAAAAAAAM